MYNIKFNSYNETALRSAYISLHSLVFVRFEFCQYYGYEIVFNCSQNFIDIGKMEVYVFFRYLGFLF